MGNQVLKEEIKEANIGSKEYVLEKQLKDYVQFSDFEGVKKCIKAGCDINWNDQFDNSALSFACASGNSVIVKYLLENGASMNFLNKHGRSPLMRAVTCCHHESAALLLAHGADPNLKNNDGYTALFFSINLLFPANIPHAVENHFKTVECLLEWGANPILIPNALIVYKIRAYKPIAKLFLEHDFDTSLLFTMDHGKSTAHNFINMNGWESMVIESDLNKRIKRLDAIFQCVVKIDEVRNEENSKDNEMESKAREDVASNQEQEGKGKKNMNAYLLDFMQNVHNSALVFSEEIIPLVFSLSS